MCTFSVISLFQGHELPHSIKFSQLRDLAKTDDPMVSLDGMEPDGEGKTTEFILQNRLKGSKKHSFGMYSFTFPLQSHQQFSKDIFDATFSAV